MGMLKLRYLTENFDLARLALTHWKHDAATLEERLGWFRISSNAVYPFDREGQLCFLRLSPAAEKRSLDLLGELDFLTFLQRRGYPAMRPIAAACLCRWIHRGGCGMPAPSGVFPGSRWRSCP